MNLLFFSLKPDKFTWQCNKQLFSFELSTKNEFTSLVIYKILQVEVSHNIKTRESLIFLSTFSEILLTLATINRWIGVWLMINSKSFQLIITKGWLAPIQTNLVSWLIATSQGKKSLSNPNSFSIKTKIEYFLLIF